MWMPSKTSVFLVESVECVVPAPVASVLTISFATKPNEYTWICINFDRIVLLGGSIKESIGLLLSDALLYLESRCFSHETFHSWLNRRFSTTVSETLC